MIVHVRRAERELGRRCVVLMDLAGPKLRTGPVEPGPAVVHWKPVRDGRGRVRAPARIWLSPWPRPEPAPSGATARLLLPERWVANLRPADLVSFTDARGARRRLRIDSARGRSFWALSKKPCYVVPETEFRALGADRGSQNATPCDIPRRPGSIRLRVGDFLDLLRNPVAGTGAEHDAAGRLQRPAMISCTLPEVLDCVRPGEPVWFDDGKIGGVVRATGPTGVRIEITRAKPGGATLRSDRGINFPDTEWQAPALTNVDIAHLSFVAQHADLVGLSFVQCPEDVLELRSRLRACGGEHLGSFPSRDRGAAENLIEILLAARRRDRDRPRYLAVESAGTPATLQRRFWCPAPQRPRSSTGAQCYRTACPRLESTARWPPGGVIREQGPHVIRRFEVERDPDGWEAPCTTLS
jgi:pyruvate kinase